MIQTSQVAGIYQLLLNTIMSRAGFVITYANWPIYWSSCRGPTLVFPPFFILAKTHFFNYHNVAKKWAEEQQKGPNFLTWWIAIRLSILSNFQVQCRWFAWRSLNSAFVIVESFSTWCEDLQFSVLSISGCFLKKKVTAARPSKTTMTIILLC